MSSGSIALDLLIKFEIKQPRLYMSDSNEGSFFPSITFVAGDLF